MFLKSFVVCILSLWLCSASAANNGTVAVGRIVGGQLTTISSVPYMVQLLKRGTFTCGGALVAPNFVLTAAHCCEDTNPADFTVVTGATKLTDTGVKSKVSKLLMPATWNPTTMHMDIALLKLATPITSGAAKTVGFYTGSYTAGTQVQVSGWGRTSEGGSISQQIRTVRVPIINKSTCTSQYRGVIALTKTMFCAGNPGSKDSCSGDSGGPVICNGAVCGVVSFGVGCARVGFPGVYTDTKASKAFIENAMKR
uniref:Peptidase S1 domain-containing protein n=1 Tax=Stomoxys calcitrans TaxID=35570 RepID=A0A1I8NXM9_STOCA